MLQEKQNMKEGNEEKKKMKKLMGSNKCRYQAKKIQSMVSRSHKAKTKAKVKNIIQGTFPSVKEILIQMSEVTY